SRKATHDALRLTDVCSLLQAGEHDEGQTAAPLFRQLPLRESHRNPKVDVRVHLFQTSWGNANDLIVSAVKLKGVFQVLVTGPVNTTPKSTTQDCYFFIAHAIFISVEKSAGYRVDS